MEVSLQSDTSVDPVRLVFLIGLAADSDTWEGAVFDKTLKVGTETGLVLDFRP